MSEQHYLRIIQKWTWLLILAMLVAMFVAYSYTQAQATRFQSSTKLIIGPGIDSPSPDQSTLRASGQLVQTYAELPHTIPFLQAVLEELDLDLTIDQLGDRIEVEFNTETQIITIRAQDPSAERAIAIANAVANRLVSISPSGSTNETALLNQQIRIQIEKLERSIAGTEAGIVNLEAELKAYQEKHDPPSPVDRVAAEIVLDDFKRIFLAEPDRDSKYLAGQQILRHIETSSQERLNQLEAELEATADLSQKRLVIDQIARERVHLSGLQSAMAEISRSVEGLPLGEHVTRIEGEIAALKAQLEVTPGIDSKRFLDDQIAQEQLRLVEARKIETDREKLVIEKIAQEQNRTVEILQLDIDKESLILSQIELERRRLSDQQDALSRLYQPLQIAMANQAHVIEPAEISVPVASQQEIYILLAGLSALVLSLALVFGFEYWSDAVETPTELEAVTAKPVLGRIPGNSLLSRGAADPLVILNQPGGQTAEAYRMLGVKLLFAIQSESMRSILFGSVQAGEAASLAAGNVAAFLSMMGKRVALIDAAPARPTNTWISELKSPPRTDEALPRGEPTSIIPFGELPGLTVYWPEPLSENGPRHLVSSQVSSLVADLKAEADLVLVVSPPLTQAESLLLSADMDGLILVVHSNRVQRKILRQIRDNLHLAGANYVGSIFMANPSPLFSAAARFMKNKLQKPQSPLPTTTLREEPANFVQGSSPDVRS